VARPRPKKCCSASPSADKAALLSAGSSSSPAPPLFLGFFAFPVMFGWLSIFFGRLFLLLGSLFRSSSLVWPSFLVERATFQIVTAAPTPNPLFFFFSKPSFLSLFVRWSLARKKIRPFSPVLQLPARFFAELAGSSPLFLRLLSRLWGGFFGPRGLRFYSASRRTGPFPSRLRRNKLFPDWATGSEAGGRFGPATLPRTLSPPFFVNVQRYERLPVVFFSPSFPVRFRPFFFS